MENLQNLSTWTAMKLRLIRTEVKDDRGEGGPVTTAVITALIVALAILVVGIIATKGTEWANSIDGPV